MTGLTHIDENGRARMIDVSGKPETERVAIASATFVTTPAVIGILRADGLPKADALATARIAGIQGAKRTSDLIPLCHPLPIDAVQVDLTLGVDRVIVTASVTTTGRTGVEMEALTAATVAALTLHDMVKAVDPAASITDVGLAEKRGGRHGHWLRGEALAERDGAPAIPPGDRSAAVLVVSTGAAAGTRADTTGPRIAVWLEEAGFGPVTIQVTPDATVHDALRATLAMRPAVLLSTGGTGISPTDRTADATAALLDTQLPGVAEAIRAKGRAATATADLSRGLAGIAGGTVVVNLPGSAGGVDDALEVLGGVLPHLLAQLAGDPDHAGGAHQSAGRARSMRGAHTGAMPIIEQPTDPGHRGAHT